MNAQMGMTGMAFRVIAKHSKSTPLLRADNANLYQPNVG